MRQLAAIPLPHEYPLYCDEALVCDDTLPCSDGSAFPLSADPEAGELLDAYGLAFRAAVYPGIPTYPGNAVYPGSSPGILEAEPVA